MNTKHATGALGAGLAALAMLMGHIATPTATAAGPPAGDRWAIVVSTAPGLPQDVWFAGQGSNATAWKGGGVVCLGHLAQGFPVGLHATIKVDVVQAGIVGPDGFPVEPGDYVAPGIELPDLAFEVVEGGTFYVILETFIVNSNIPGLTPGDTGRLMFTFDFDGRLGRVDRVLVAWMDVGGQFVPFLNEGLMMTNVRLR
jgi:hypothetical protein